MDRLLSQLLSQGPVVTDGAWGTQLQARGLEVGACPDAWNDSHPDAVEEVARAYVDAGSQVILTNTFGANRIVLAGHGLEDQAPHLNRLGAQISRRAAGNSCHVFGSIGPSGKMLMTGEVTEEELHVAFREQAMALAAGGAVGLVVETMSDLAEACIALSAARETGLPVISCMLFDSGAEKDRTMMGQTPEACAETLTASGAKGIGANCGQGIEAYVPICRRLSAATSLPVWIKANAGLPEIVDGRTEYRATPESFAAHASALVEAGASFLGGCCGTHPGFVRALRAALGG